VSITKQMCFPASACSQTTALNRCQSALVSAWPVRIVACSIENDRRSQEELKMENLQRLNENSTRGRLSLPRHRLLVRTALVAAALF